MRTPADLPRRRRRRREGPGRGRVWLVVLAVVLVVVGTSLRGIAGFYTDYLWFDSLGLSGVFTGVLQAKVALGVIFTGVFFALLWGNLLIADRLAPRFRPAGPEEDLLERYHDLVGDRTGLVRLLVSALFAVIAGAGVSGQWHSWILFTNHQTVGVRDPQFDTDVGFYLFQLPFLSFLVDWAFASVVIILIVTAVAHYLNGGIRASGAAQRVTPQVKAHLSVLLGVLALLKAGGYWLQRYELNFSTRGTVDGATYTDVKAQLPVLYLLILISLAAFLLFIVNIWRRGWALPVIAVGLWAFVALLAGGIYPALVQRFSVEPSESSKERPYITRNIEATREALGLAEVNPVDFAANDALDGDGLARNAETVRNIRLWDPLVLRKTYEQIQRIRGFYGIRDVDVDRYDLDGRTTQMVLSTRELNTAGVPQDSWEARHLAFTHGYGLAMAPANAQVENGRPDLVVRDVPVQAEPELEVERPGIYIGEEQSGYVVVDTDRQEIDFQDEDGDTQYTEYTGEDGVEIGSLVNKVAFALRFGDINPLISGNIRGGSRILFQRDVRERVETLAPFLSFDADPYAVLVDGELKWVVDAYTTSDHYPYGQGADRTDLPNRTGLDHQFNYVRNSVKAVVDAYDGSVDFYVVDPDDPLAAAYGQAFPELFTDGDEIPDELREHFRYPEDLFRVQTNMWGRYHIDDPDDFYNQNDAWAVSRDPGTAASEETGATDTQGDPVAPGGSDLIDPYYQLMRLPEAEDEEFLMLRPFVPLQGENGGRQLTAFMVAKSDPGSYGELSTYVMPSGDLPDGPPLISADIRSNEQVSELETLLGQRGSNILYGNLLLIPIEESLLYVQPLYVEANQNQTPELRKVIVSFEGEVQVADTLREALIAQFGSAPDTLEEVDGTEPPPEEQPPPGEEPPATDEDVAGLLARAAQALEDAEAALREGDLAGYEELVEEAQSLVDEARDLADPEGSSSSSTTTSSTTTTTAPSA